MRVHHPLTTALREQVRARTFTPGLTDDEKEDVERWERLMGELGYDVLRTPWIERDGGRESEQHEGMSGDCVTRAICNAGRLSYMQVYDALAEFVEARETRGTGVRKSKRSSPEDGIAVSTLHVFIHYALGWRYVQALTTLDPDKLPGGNIVCALDGHLTAMIDGVVLDNFDPTKQGFRRVKGYWEVR